MSLDTGLIKFNSIKTLCESRLIFHEKKFMHSKRFIKIEFLHKIEFKADLTRKIIQISVFLLFYVIIR